MEHFYPSEIATLALGTILFVIGLASFRKETLTEFKLFYVGFFFILAANFFTVIEGAFLKVLFNFLEHLSYFLSSLAFAAACWRMLPGKEPRGGTKR